MELTELLLTMAGEQNVQTAAVRLLHGALEKWPDVVLLALFQVPVRFFVLVAILSSN